MGLHSLRIADQGSMSEMAIFQQPFVPTCVGARKVLGSDDAHKAMISDESLRAGGTSAISRP